MVLPTDVYNLYLIRCGMNRAKILAVTAMWDFVVWPLYDMMLHMAQQQHPYDTNQTQYAKFGRLSDNSPFY